MIDALTQITSKGAGAGAQLHAVRLGLDTTDALPIATVDGADPDVALLAPGGAPRVFDQPVSSAIFDAVTDHEHSMVFVSLNITCDKMVLSYHIEYNTFIILYYYSTH